MNILRTITDHKTNGLNEAIHIDAVGKPGLGGANHRYFLIGHHESNLFDDRGPRVIDATFTVDLRFQNGPISKAKDMNGITNEALLAVVIDRMRGFQHPIVNTMDGGTGHDFSARGTYACRENACALTHLEEALMWLQKRSRDRMARGVEGSMKK